MPPLVATVTVMHVYQSRAVRTGAEAATLLGYNSSEVHGSEYLIANRDLTDGH